MSDFFDPIHLSSNNNNIHNKSKEDYTMNNNQQPNYTKISHIPGINGLILELEDQGIIFGDRILVDTTKENDKVNSLIVMGSYWMKNENIQEYGDEDADGNYPVVASYDHINVNLLLAYGEELIMWSTFQYAVDKNGNYIDIGVSMNYWYSRFVWSMSKAREVQAQFIAASRNNESSSFDIGGHELFSWKNTLGSDMSHRYYPALWIKTDFVMMDDFVLRPES